MKIQSGDKAVIISPAGVPEDVSPAVYSLKKFGIETEIYPVNPCNFYPDTKTFLADSDFNRVSAIEKAFLDKKVKLILCSRGGYGCLRILDFINYKIIEENPKFFAGFSDITALLLNIYKKTGLITFHAPMASSSIGQEFLDILNGQKNVIEAINPVYYSGMQSNSVIEGILWGGNLSVLTSMLGSDFIPDEDLILFLEDINEPLYKIDRMFTQIFRCNSLKNKIKAIVLGEFLPHSYESLNNLFNSFPVNTVGGFKITHGEGNITVPVGARAKLTGGRILFGL